MTNTAGYPKTQRATLLLSLYSQIQRTADDRGFDIPSAVLATAIRILGYDPDNGTTTDGSGDGGFDHIEIREREATIFQSKAIDVLDGWTGTDPTAPTLLSDLSRIRSVLENIEKIPADLNATTKRKLAELRTELNRAGRAFQESLRDEDPNARTTDEPETVAFEITVNLVTLYGPLTAEAKREFAALSKADIVQCAGIPVRLRWRFYSIDDLLAERWKQENDDWRDKDGKSRDRVSLSIIDKELLRPGASAVFFTRAIDLVRAFEDFGYQIFESNVRAEIHKSPVNREIQKSVMHRRTREEFRHLNNGITIVSDGFSFKGPKGEPSAIDVTKPGVVNGLQTVKSLYEGYRALETAKDQEHFESQCTVLCRVHQKNAVSDVGQLIKATNNQNPMDPRNLRSNEAEQKTFERLFAEMGWFYERKEGAWRAFQENSKTWPTKLNKSKRDFKSGKAERYVSNDDIAQFWLCFMGLSQQATNLRREIFSQEDDKLYRLSFLVRPTKHAYYSNYSLDSVLADANKELSPTPEALLLSFALFELFNHVNRSPKESRDEAIQRLGLDPTRTRQELEAELVKDDEYLTDRILNASKALFIDIAGWLLFEAFGSDVHTLARNILEAGTTGEFFRHLQYEPSLQAVRQRRLGPDDIVLLIRELYRYVIQRSVSDDIWRKQYDAAPNKTRFLYSEVTRRRFIEQLKNIDQMPERRKGGIGEDWSAQFDDAKGVIKYFREWRRSSLHR